MLLSFKMVHTKFKLNPKKVLVKLLTVSPYCRRLQISSFLMVLKKNVLQLHFCFHSLFFKVCTTVK